MRRMLVALIAIAIASPFALLPAGAADPLQDLVNAPNRYKVEPPGTEKQLRYVFGPFVIPPGQDNNKVLLDLPVHTGFMRSVQPNMINVNSGEEFSEQVAHIHHAHWLRVTNDKRYEYYANEGNETTGPVGLSWVFGTGEERTGGSVADRESISEGWRYGISVDGTTPIALIFMIHNKTFSTITAYITLDVDFIYGSKEQLAANDIDMHELRGVLTGTTKDALPNVAVGNGVNSKNGVLMQQYTSGFSGTIVASAGHMHPGGKAVYVANLGPTYQETVTVNNQQVTLTKFVCAKAGSNGLEAADLDGDDIPGTTLLVSDKIDQVPGAWPYSEDYQMGATQPGFRAPIHEGDVIKQFGVYDVQRSGTMGLPLGLFDKDTNGDPILDSRNGRPHAWYEAMSYTGFYTDTENTPAGGTSIDASECSLANFAPTLIAANGPNQSSDPTDTFTTHPWWHTDDVCGVSSSGFDYDACHQNDVEFKDGEVVNTITSANFVYMPGDLTMRDPFDGKVAVPLVKAGTDLHLVNADVGLLVRHTFTSCPAPCDGTYVANYPLPDGLFDTGKLGNLDYIDGGFFQDDDTLPYKSMKIDGRFTVGQTYTYYCSIHPTMRGSFKVIA